MKKIWIVLSVIAVSLLAFSLTQLLKPKPPGPPFSEPGEELWLEIRSSENGSELLLNNWQDCPPTSRSFPSKVENFLLRLNFDNRSEEVKIESMRYGEFRKYRLKSDLREDQVVKYEFLHESGLRLSGEIVVDKGPIFIGVPAKDGSIEDRGWLNLIKKENGTFLQVGSFVGRVLFWVRVDENGIVEEFSGEAPQSWKLKKDLRPGEMVMIRVMSPVVMGGIALVEVDGRNARLWILPPL
jgi:hypothetical protein